MTAAVDAPTDAVCIEPSCTRDASHLRPLTMPWLTDEGVLVDADEWVCVLHA